MQRDRSWLRPLAGVVILAVLVWRLGAGAFVAALGHLDPWSVAAATAIAGVTTVCGSWRWVLVARGLGTDLSLRSAVAECYRSQFLNVTLPGGVLGDVNRGVRHGRGGGDLARGLRSVVWERTAGQVVLAAMAVGVALLLPSPVAPAGSLGSSLAAVLLVVAALVLVVVLVARAAPSLSSRPWSGRALPVRVARAAMADVRSGLLGRHTWPGVVGASALVVSGHVATLLLAARAAGVSATTAQLLPLALVVLVATGVPLNIAGWGLREGAAAWVFGAAGLGTAAGVGTAVVYGVMAFVAALPGGALLVLTRRARLRPTGALVREGALRG